MDDARNALTPHQPPRIEPLNAEDLALIQRTREALVGRAVKSPSWRETDPQKRRQFFDEVRSILIEQGSPVSTVNRQAQIVTDALSGIGMLDQLLRDPFVEEIFVRKGEAAVEYDGTFYYLGKLADDRYFEDLAIHVADQGGATIRGDRPAVLIDLPGGERFTAIIPRLSTEGTAINIRTFGRRIKTLEQMEQAGTFAKRGNGVGKLIERVSSPELQARIRQLQEAPDRFLAWVAATLSGSILVAGEMGAGKTTLLNALSGFLPENAPIAALETFRELDIQRPFLTSHGCAGGTAGRHTGRDPGLGLERHLYPHEPGCHPGGRGRRSRSASISQGHLPGAKGFDHHPRRDSGGSVDAPGAARPGVGS